MSAKKAKFTTYCIIGLGNNDQKYFQTRHNVGFWLQDEVLKYLYRMPDIFKINEHQKRYSTVWEISSPNNDFLFYIARYNKYMNTSGECIKDLSNFKIDRIMIACDDLDSEVGHVKFASDTSGSGGHNGIKSIIQSCGSKYKIDRIKIGIGRPIDSKNHQDLVSDYVLSDIGFQDAEIINEALRMFVLNINHFLNFDIMEDGCILQKHSDPNLRLKNIQRIINNFNNSFLKK